MLELILFCPRCNAELELTDSQQSFEVILASRTTCEECGASVIIENNKPRLPREEEPD